MAEQQPFNPGDRVKVKRTPVAEMWFIYTGLRGEVQQAHRAAFPKDETGYTVQFDARGDVPGLRVTMPEHTLEADTAPVRRTRATKVQDLPAGEEGDEAPVRRRRVSPAAEAPADGEKPSATKPRRTATAKRAGESSVAAGKTPRTRKAASANPDAPARRTRRTKAEPPGG